MKKILKRMTSLPPLTSPTETATLILTTPENKPVLEASLRTTEN